MWADWLETAFLCRYGHQDVYRLRGIEGRTLTPLERSLFALALEEHVRAEFSEKRDPLGVRPHD